MHLAVDVHYWEAEDRARVAAVGFVDWRNACAAFERVREARGLAPYQPGEFFRRELPCLLPLIREVGRSTGIETVVVDGYVDLDAGRPGLGRHLWDVLGRNLEVVGVAKNPFVNASAVEVRRGTSARPLWVTSTGDVEAAAARVASMHGEHRIPTLLKRTDHRARFG